MAAAAGQERQTAPSRVDWPAFERWACGTEATTAALPEAHGSPTLAPFEDQKTGQRGLRLLRDLVAEEAAVRIPAARLVTPFYVAKETSWGRALLRARLPSQLRSPAARLRTGELNAIQWLVFFLTVAHDMTAPAAAELREHWKPYLLSLPVDFSHCPGHSCYPGRALRQLRCLYDLADPLLEELGRNRDRDFRVVREALSLAQQALCSNGNATGIAESSNWEPQSDSLEWAWWVVNTRSITCFTRHGDADVPDGVALAPWLDLLNHDSRARTEAVYDENDKAFVLRSLVPCATGGEFFICYGAHDSLHLLLEYGFTGPDNPLDVVSMGPAIAAALACDVLTFPAAVARRQGQSGSGHVSDGRSTDISSLALHTSAWRRVWKLAQELGVDHDLVLLPVSGEPSWALWRVVCAFALADAAGQDDVKNKRKRQSTESLVPTVRSHLLGHLDDLDPVVQRRAWKIFSLLCCWSQHAGQLREQQALRVVEREGNDGSAEPISAFVLTSVWSMHRTTMVTLERALELAKDRMNVSSPH